VKRGVNAAKIRGGAKNAVNVQKQDGSKKGQTGTNPAKRSHPNFKKKTEEKPGKENFNLAETRPQKGKEK